MVTCAIYIPVESNLSCLHYPTLLDAVSVSDLEKLSDQDTDDAVGYGMRETKQTTSCHSGLRTDNQRFDYWMWNKYIASWIVQKVC